MAYKPASEAAILYRKAGDANGEYWPLADMGKSNLYMSKSAEAETYFRQALPLAPDANFSALTKVYLAQARADNGDLDSASRYLKDALPVIRQSGDTGTEAQAFLAAGNVAKKRGDLSDARDYFSKAAKNFTMLGDEFTSNAALKEVSSLKARYFFKQYFIPSVSLASILAGIRALLKTARLRWILTKISGSFRTRDRWRGSLSPVPGTPFHRNPIKPEVLSDSCAEPER